MFLLGFISVHRISAKPNLNRDRDIMSTCKGSWERILIYIFQKYVSQLSDNINVAVSQFRIYKRDNLDKYKQARLSTGEFCPSNSTA